jgi:hypothetical protein
MLSHMCCAFVARRLRLHDGGRVPRPACKQVCIALVVSFEGFPLGYEVFPGTTHDSRTVQTIATTILRAWLARNVGEPWR